MTTQRDISARLDRAAAGARAADRVIARIDERERNSQVSCGTGTAVGKANGDVRVEGLGAGTVVPDNRAKTAVNSVQSSGSESQQNCAGLGAEWGIPPAGKTESEQAVDKHWPKYFAEWAKLQQAANGIAVKPHDCFENLSAQLVCSVCGAAWVEERQC